MSEEKQQTGGVFKDILFRKNSQIKQDRAIAILKFTENRFRSSVEAMSMELFELTTKRSIALDLSPSNSQSLSMADNFDATKFVETDTAYSEDIYRLEIRIKIRKDRYKELFGKELVIQELDI